MAVKLQTTSSESIFNAVRSYMSPSFQERIPVATAQNLKDIGVMLTSDEYEMEFNQWQKALVNRIGMVIFNDYVLQNPLSKYIYGTMSFGDAIEEIAVDIVKGAAMNYGKEGESLDPFIKMTNQAKAEYHRINEPIQYGTTIEFDRIKRAFTDANGMTRLIGMFVSKLYSSANLDTWLLTKGVMASYINDVKATTFPLLPTQKVHANDIVDEASAKKFIIQVRNALSAMKFPNNAFNPQKVHKTLERKELTLFIRADILNVIGVEAMASAFNIDELNMNVKIEEMDDFGTDPSGNGTDDVLAVLAEDWWLLITQQFEDLESIRNPRGRYTNYFLTRQMSFGCSYFKDCVIFAKRYPETPTP